MRATLAFHGLKKVITSLADETSDIYDNGLKRAARLDRGVSRALENI